jgi:hypothetical protein
MRGDGLVSLYLLEKQTGVHRDTLKRLASYEGIPVIRRPDRCRTRCVAQGKVRELTYLAQWWANRPRPYARDDPSP